MFDTMNATDLNTRLKDLMDGLSVKVSCADTTHDAVRPHTNAGCGSTVALLRAPPGGLPVGIRREG